jgi:hypothetical protein
VVVRSSANVIDECVGSRGYCERCGVGRGAHDSGGGRKGNSGRRSKRGDRFRTVPCTANFSIPNNRTRFYAEIPRYVVTKVKLHMRIEDEETGWEREIACVNEAGEEMVRLCVNGERLGLKYRLEYTIEDREGEVDGSDS